MLPTLLWQRRFQYQTRQSMFYAAFTLNFRTLCPSAQSPRAHRPAGRSDGVSRRVKRPIEFGPSAIACVLSPLVGVPSGTSKTYRSLLLAVSSSTINKPSEYMILKLSPFGITSSFVRMLPDSLNRHRDQGQIQDSRVFGTNCHFFVDPEADAARRSTHGNGNGQVFSHNVNLHGCAF